MAKKRSGAASTSPDVSNIPEGHYVRLTKSQYDALRGSPDNSRKTGLLAKAWHDADRFLGPHDEVLTAKNKDGSVYYYIPCADKEEAQETLRSLDRFIRRRPGLVERHAGENFGIPTKTYQIDANGHEAAIKCPGAGEWNLVRGFEIAAYRSTIAWIPAPMRNLGNWMWENYNQPHQPEPEEAEQEEALTLEP